MKRDIYKSFSVNFPDNVATEFDPTCNKYGQACLSSANLKSYQRHYTTTEVNHYISTCRECK